jgi:predicted outer membrane protein
MNDTLSRGITLMTLAASMTLAACKPKDNGATADTTAAKMAMPDTSTKSAANAVASLTDANIAALVDEVNAADSTLAAAALRKLTTPGARRFAKLMIGEHHGLHVKGIQVEKAQKITPELPATDPFKPAVGAEQSALAPMAKGKGYDSTYIANEVGIHQAVIEWQGKNAPQNAALQDYMKSSKTVYQRHLDDGLAAQSKLGGGPMS